MLCFLSNNVDLPLPFSMDYCKEIQSYMYIIQYTYYIFKIVYSTPSYNGLLIDTCLYIMIDLLYLNYFFCIRKLFCYPYECNTFHHSFVS